MAVLTRIKNNQVTDASAGNVYLGVNAAAKVQDYSITAGKIQNNLTYGSDLTITGNLTVQGNTTTIDTVNLVVEDPLILLAKEQTGSPTLDIGFIGKRGTSDNIAWVWDESANSFVSVFTTSEVTNTTITISSYAAITTANISATTGNFSGNVQVANLSVVGNISGTANFSGNVTASNFLTTGLVSATGNVTGGNVNTGGAVSATGNVNSGNVNTAIVSASGNVTGANLVTGGLVTATGNITGGNVLTGGLISATGNINSGANIVATANVVGGNLTTGGVVTATGNVTGGNLNTSGAVSATGNVNSGNVNTGIISASGNVNGTGAVFSGNVTAQYFFGNIAGNIDAAGSNTQVQFNNDDSLGASSNFTFDTATNILTVTGTVQGTTVSATGNVIGGNVSTAGVVTATGNVTGGNVNTGGAVSATGNVNSGNVNTGIMSASGNVTGANVVTGGLITATGNVTGGNVNTGGAVSATGNVNSGNVNTGIMSASGNVTGANLVTGGLVTATGNVTGGNVNTGGAVSATGNVNSGNVNTGIVSASGNVNSGNVNTAIVSASGNVTGANLVTGGLITATGNINGAAVNTALVASTGGITISSGGSSDLALSAGGNINADSNYINNLNNPVQDQDAATKVYVDNLVATGLTYHEAVFVSTTANLATTTGGTITYAQPNGAGNGIGATITTTGSFNLIDTGNVQTVGTRILVKDEGNAVLNGVYTWSNATAITRSTDADQYGIDSSQALSLNSYFFTESGNVNKGSAYVLTEPTSTITFGSSNIVFDLFSTSQVYSANAQAGISLVGTVFSAKVDNDTTAFDGGGNISVKPGANLVTPNIGAATGTSLSVTGNVTGGNLNTGGAVSATGNVNSGNVNTAIVSATGNVNSGNVNTTLVSATGNVIGGNVSTAGVVTATGNVTGGNVLTGGLISATGNVNSGANIVATANVIGGNITTAGVVSATGNVTGGNLVTGGLVQATGNVNSGNVNTTLVSATGNVIGGNVSTAGVVTATGNVTGGNLNTGGAVSATGNVNSGNVNTGIVSATGNVAAVGFTGGNVSVTGNVYAQNFIGNISGNIDAAGANTEVQFNNNDLLGASANFTFNSATNVLTVTGDIQGTTVSATGNVIGGNVSTAGLVTATGNVTGGNVNTGGAVSATGNVNSGNVNTGIMSAAGNVTGANVVTGGLVTATGNVTGGNLSTAGLVTATGNVTGGNVLTGGLVSATGNITAANLILTSGTIDGPAAGRITINASDLDTDFAIDGDSTPNIFYVDAGVGTASFGNSGAITNAIVSFNTTDSIKMPVGNTAQRPDPATVGMLRFSTASDALEIYTSSGWEAVGVPAFTVVTDDQFAGTGACTTFTLSEDSTTAATIVSINGVVQIPTTAYSVTGNSLVFTEAPEVSDVIDARLITTTTTVTSISNTSGNAVVEVIETAPTVQITGNLLPSANVTYDLGSNTMRWNDAYFNGTSITLGNVIIKNNTGNTIGFFGPDGTTPATIDSTNIDTTTIANGTSSMAVIASGGNIQANVNGSSIITITSGGIINNMGNGVGNIGNATGYFNTIFAKATSAQYADLAEMYVADQMIEPGTVVCFGGDHEVTICDQDSCSRVAGVISTNPSYIMNAGLAGDHVVAVALTGRVPTRVTGQVRKGDMMVSTVDGRARACATPAVGQVIGKALADFDGTDGVIEVVVGRL